MEKLKNSNKAVILKKLDKNNKKYFKIKQKKQIKKWNQDSFYRYHHRQDQVSFIIKTHLIVR